MEVLLYKIEKLFKDKNIDIPDIELFRFGLSKLFANLIVVVVILCISIFLHTTISSMVLLASFLFLRSKTGGFHFNNSKQCFVFSIVAPVFLGWLIQMIDISKVVPMMGCILAILFTVWLSPVDHPNKKLDENERIYFRKATVRSLLLLLFIIIILERVVHIYEIAKFIQFGIIVNFLSMIFALIRNANQCRNR